jgi:NitT/TauT family transport system substrate-binding protein
VAHIAQQKGFFNKAGLDVTVVRAAHGAASIDAIAQGRADIAIAADVPFVIATMRDSPIAMLAAVTTIANDNAVVARRDRAISSLQDLAGKTVGVTRGTSGAYFLWAYLIRNRIAPESVTLRDLAPDALTSALTSGQVDAIAAWQPISLAAEAALGTSGISFNEFDTYRTTITATASNAFLAERPPGATKFIRALLATERFMQAEPREAIEITATWLKLDRAVLGLSWPRYTTRVSLLQPHLTTMEDQARWAMATGYVPRQRLPNFLPHLHVAALLAVAPERVTVLR